MRPELISETLPERNIMISIEDYKANPCGAFSIPYWKAKSMAIPSNMRIVHNREFDRKLLEKYVDREFFRLIHYLKNIPVFPVSGILFETISPHRSGELADMINSSYTHSEIRVSEDDIESLAAGNVFCPELWIGAVSDGKLVGSIICDFDPEVGEAMIEWLQVLPEYRQRGIATALVCKALSTMSAFADFATVSGECDNITEPESVYRKCGFEGNDVWHILYEK